MPTDYDRWQKFADSIDDDSETEDKPKNWGEAIERMDKIVDDRLRERPQARPQPLLLRRQPQPGQEQEQQQDQNQSQEQQHQQDQQQQCQTDEATDIIDKTCLTSDGTGLDTAENDSKSKRREWRGRRPAQEMEEMRKMAAMATARAKAVKEKQDFEAAKEKKPSAEARKAFPDIWEALCQGKKALKQSDVGAAESAWRRALTMLGNGVSEVELELRGLLAWRLGQISAEREDWKAAYEWLKNAPAVGEARPEVQYWRSFVRFHLDVELEETWRELVSLVNSNPVCHRGIDLMHEVLGRLEELDKLEMAMEQNKKEEANDAEQHDRKVSNEHHKHINNIGLYMTIAVVIVALLREILLAQTKIGEH